MIEKRGIGQNMLLVASIVLPLAAGLGALYAPWWVTLGILVAYFCFVRYSPLIFITACISGALYDVLFWSGRGSLMSLFIHTFVFLAVALSVYAIRKYTRVFE